MEGENQLHSGTGLGGTTDCNLAACPTGGHCVPRWNRPSMLMFDVNCVDSGNFQKGKFRYETSGALLAGTTLNSSSNSSRSPISSPCESLASMNGGVRGRNRYLQAPTRNMQRNRVGSKSSGYHTRTKRRRWTSTVVVGLLHIQMSSNQAATARMPPSTAYAEKKTHTQRDFELLS
jgi:hypothetical protein